jgi:hypothetical protein
MARRYTLSLLAAVLALGLPSVVSAQMQPGITFPPLAEPASRGLRGHYFLEKGRQAFERGRYASALDRWQISAYWGHKIAQYNLGLMHFKGVGVKTDHARGVAWLALAAERGDTPLADALEWGYAQLTPEEIARANAIWREELKPRYGDAVAMPRAMSLWRMDLAMQTGSHLGHTIGPLAVTEFSTGETIDGMNRQHRLRSQGGPYEANPVYPRVEVGDLVPLESKRRR